MLLVVVELTFVSPARGALVDGLAAAEVFFFAVSVITFLVARNIGIHVIVGL